MRSILQNWLRPNRMAQSATVIHSFIEILVFLLTDDFVHSSDSFILSIITCFGGGKNKLVKLPELCVFDTSL